MSHAVTVDLRLLDPARFGVARRLVAAAFSGEPFTFAMYPPTRLDRFVGLHADYADWPGAAATTWGVWAGDALLGVTSAFPAGCCPPCAEDPTLDPDTLSPSGRVNHVFRLRCRDAHRQGGLPPHAYLGTVAIEPAAAGHGIGRQLVRGVVERLWRAGEHCVVLECVRDLVPFYARCGFRVVSEFDDPGAPGLRSCCLRADRTA